MILLDVNWHPFFSYEWWTDIGVPTIGAIGSIAVGGGAVVVAFHSNRIAAAADQREAAAGMAAQAAEDRAERGEFAAVVSEWNRAEVRQRIKGLVPDRRTKPASVLREEVDLRAATIGQYSEELVRTLKERLSGIPKGADSTSDGQALALVWLHYSRPTVRSWVADPERWWAGEQEDRASLRELRDFGDGLPDA